MATEDPSQPHNTHAAANTRVTPEELAQALARIEARQAEQAKHQETTISIGQAMEELGVSVDPELILAEVQAQRGQSARRMTESLANTPRPLAAQAVSNAPAAVPVPQPRAAADEVANCPACGRKLLTRASALCSWCGARIDNPDYQVQAEAQRHALDQAERTQVETIAQEEARYGVFGRLKRRAKQGLGPKPGPG